MKAYSYPLAWYLLVEDAVVEQNTKEVTGLHVEVYKDREAFTLNLVNEMTKTDAVTATMVRRRFLSIPESDDVTVTEETNKEKLLERTLDILSDKTIIETTNIMKK